MRFWFMCLILSIRLEVRPPEQVRFLTWMGNSSKMGLICWQSSFNTNPVRAIYTFLFRKGPLCLKQIPHLAGIPLLHLAPQQQDFLQECFSQTFKLQLWNVRCCRNPRWHNLKRLFLMPAWCSSHSWRIYRCMSWTADLPIVKLFGW